MSDEIDVRVVLDGRHASRFNRLREKMKEESSHRKTGKAATVRFAISMACARLDQLEDKANLSAAEFRETVKKIRNHLD